jgi:hypothetical protein
MTIASAGSTKADQQTGVMQTDQPVSLTGFDLKLPDNLDDYDPGVAELFKSFAAANEHMNKQLATVQQELAKSEAMRADMKKVTASQAALNHGALQQVFERQLNRIAEQDERVAKRYGIGIAEDMDHGSKAFKRRDSLLPVWFKMRKDMAASSNGRINESVLMRRSLSMKGVHVKGKAMGKSATKKTNTAKVPATPKSDAPVSRATHRRENAKPATAEEREHRTVRKIDEILARGRG